ncbi:hypothetical protein AYI69_g9513 [Smittium culicis]|uniref:Uncharacterized protein n=1 Tax=Smittium culicis TaxID=133412 RepID=A0A1R1XC44_9FUNG|nr:hypothetical protein AYI69_g9513 [Smittium culicis]
MHSAHRHPKECVQNTLRFDSNSNSDTENTWALKPTPLTRNKLYGQSIYKICSSPETRESEHNISDADIRPERTKQKHFLLLDMAHINDFALKEGFKMEGLKSLRDLILPENYTAKLDVK